MNKRGGIDSYFYCYYKCRKLVGKRVTERDREREGEEEDGAQSHYIICVHSCSLSPSNDHSK